MGKARVDKGKTKVVEKEPERKSKRILVKKNGKGTKSKRAQSSKGKANGKAKGKPNDRALAIAQSYSRGKTRIEIHEWMGSKKRANSTGLFGSTPSLKPIRIDISNGM